MKPIPKRVSERLITGLKRFQPILNDAKARDINESDTVVIINDMLSNIFGYDKYSEVTSEFSIRGTYCDLATRVEGKTQYLIEVKAIGNDLKDAYIKQAVDYAANQGIEWVVLTNGVHWIAYRVTFGKPIDKDTVFEFNFLELNHKNKEHLEELFCLTKEGCIKSVFEDFHNRRQVLSKYFIGSILISDTILNTIRKELRKIEPDIKIETDQIKQVLENDIIKREVMESEKTKDASKKIHRHNKRQQKKKASPQIEKVDTTVSPNK